MTANELTEFARLIETVVKSFGAGAVPFFVAAWLYFNSKKAEKPKENPFTELQSEIKGLRIDISEMKERVAKIEGGLGL